jgi:hypothetical protein
LRELAKISPCRSAMQATFSKLILTGFVISGNWRLGKSSSPG